MKSLLIVVTLLVLCLHGPTPALASANADRTCADRTCADGKCKVDRPYKYGTHKNCGPLGCHEVQVQRAGCPGCPCDYRHVSKQVKIKSRFPFLYRVLHPRTW